MFGDEGARETANALPAALRHTALLPAYCFILTILFSARLPQILLPRTGGRLVLATDGVWSQAAGRALTAMWQAPLKMAAHEVIKSLAGRNADASIIVVDVLPPKTTFQEVCKKQEALAARAAPAGSSGGGVAGIGKGAGQAMMRVLKLGR